MKKWILVAVVILVFFVVGGSAVLAKVPLLKHGAHSKQAGSQMARPEFTRLRRGLTEAQLRALAGEPQTTSKSEVEGVKLQCWLYGVAKATGAFQICFANGRLASKSRFS